MIHEILIQNYEEKYSPPEGNLLRLALVGDVLFLDIVKRTETNKSVTTEQVDAGHVDVPVQALLDAVHSLARSQQRDDLAKEYEHKGGLTIRV